MIESNIKYRKGQFTAIVSNRLHQQLPFYQFSHIVLHHIKIDKIEELEYYNSWELNTSNSWYKKVIKPYKNWFFSRQWEWRWPSKHPKKTFPWFRINWKWSVWRKRAHVFIPLDENYQLQEILYEVILKEISFDDNGAEWVGGFHRIKGTVYFQIGKEKLKKEAPKTIVEQTQNNTDKEHEAAAIGISGETKVTNLSQLNKELQQDSEKLTTNQSPFQMKKKTSQIWLLLMFLWLLFCFWKFPALLLPSLVVFGAIAFFRYFRKACLGLLISLMIFGVLGFLLFNFLAGKGKEQKTVKTEDGTIKILPPVKTKDKDLYSQKEIRWWDFINNKYDLNYGTSATSFFESETLHAEKCSQINASNSIEYFQKLYSFMENNDTPKLDSIIQKFQIKAKEKNLNALKTAEMVCTFVQEIPYYLVHEFDCQKSVEQSGSDFVAQYHRENKPCLPSIPGGVQSPYEFMHNLKGDCDTRSLLAFTILKGLGISSSVWISEAYGHSVLGVGLPAGNGFYVEVQGDKHYAIELTAKGFRLGMISPEQQIENNWDIALFYKR